MKGFHQIDNRCKKNNMTYFTNDKNGTVKGLVEQSGRCTPSKSKKGDDEDNDENNDENSDENDDENNDENNDEDNGDDGEEDEKDEEENKEDDGEEGNGAGDMFGYDDK